MVSKVLLSESPGRITAEQEILSGDGFYWTEQKVLLDRAEGSTGPNRRFYWTEQKVLLDRTEGSVGPVRMRYCSTRGGVQNRDFREVLFSGFAPDGGMFMPETLPTVSPETLRSWKGLRYQRLVLEIAALFIPEELIPRDDLEGLVAEALSGFSVPDSVRIVQLKDGLSVLELFHGETLAFKDLAMSCTVHFLDYFLRKDGSRAVVLVGTSGDTGGSAVRSARSLPGLDVLVVFPRGRITAVQEKHMTTCLEDNVHVFAADGSSDDIDQPLRRLFADQNLVRTHGLMSLNSVNWSRVMIQVAHFFYAYLELSGLGAEPGQGAEPGLGAEPGQRAEPGQGAEPGLGAEPGSRPGADTGALPELEVVVPTGGAGNIAAAFVAVGMGLPLKLVAMVNANDIVHRTVTSGDFSMAPSITQTVAPAIDIQDPYNMERVFWLLLDRDGAAVKTMMEEFQCSHRLRLPEDQRRLLAEVLVSGAVSDPGILETMRRCWDQNRYLLCPHTAVAVWHHYNRTHSTTRNRCYVATASPAKFQAAVEKAGLTFDPPEAVLALDQLPTRYQNLERSTDWCKDWEERLRDWIQFVSRTRKNGGVCYPTTSCPEDDLTVMS